MTRSSTRPTSASNGCTVCAHGRSLDIPGSGHAAIGHPRGWPAQTGRDVGRSRAPFNVRMARAAILLAATALAPERRCHNSQSMALMPHDRARVLAVLGPTNTGKTHFAVERMLAHRSGLIGFPLRLLAREIYDRIVVQKGAGLVALITGEERIQPPTARYFVATVEAMPSDLGRELPRGRRDPAVRRSRARPRLHRPAAARARPRRDDVPGRRHHPAAAEAAGARGRGGDAAALLDAHLHRARQGHPPAARAAPWSRSRPRRSTRSPS